MNLFGALGHEELGDLNPFPEVLLNNAGFERVLDRATDCLGIDFEFNPKTEKPSILGISVRNLAAAVKWEPNQARKTLEWCIKNGIKLVGHSVIGADKPVLEKALGIKTTLDMWEDTMVEHYICHHDFTKNTAKDDDGEGSLGLMNLYVMASMTTNAYQWKICRGRACDGPCPKHNVFEYCAIDSWAGIEGHYVMQEEMKQMGVPHHFYRELMELSEVCDQMERQGLRINIPYIEKLNVEMEEAKDKIFEYEEVGKNRYYKEFNPRSSDQIITWFKARGENYKTTDIKYIQKVLEKKGADGEHGELAQYLQYLDENFERQDEVTRNLYKLYNYKKSGKGSDAWFDEKYRERDFIHPRFIVTGTSSGRLASSRPNFQNIPTRGWAAIKDQGGNEYNRIKAAIIPRSDDLDFLEADASQLELRVVLYLAGLDPAAAGPDAFTWLIQQDYEGFKKAAALWPGLDENKVSDVRDVAKSMSHAANYMEGIKIFYATDLESTTIKRQIENGAIRLYSDWEYCGGIVGFTGSNLAFRFFGSRSDANRKIALTIQEDVYFKNFPDIRKWQQKVLAEIEARGYVQSPTGRFLRLYGSPEDNAKIGVAFMGQGVGGDHIEAIMLRYKREQNFIFDLMVHDSLLAGIPKGWSDKQAFEFIEPMSQESGIRLPGFRAPIKVKRGANYGEMHKLKT